MISERDFASSFQSFWTEVLPLLTPNFVHIINESFKERLVDKHGTPIPPIEIGSEIRYPPIVAEFGFFLAKAMHLNNVKIFEITRKPEQLEKAERAAIQAISRFEGNFYSLNDGLRLNKEELSEGIQLAENYEIFFSIFKNPKDIEFNPKVPGAGFLNSCEGDISIGLILIEVKTVNRNLSGKDIRQLITYLALQASTNKRKWYKAGFFNPRKAVYYIFDIDNLMYRISGGKSATEIFDEIIDFVTSRDIQIESQF